MRHSAVFPHVSRSSFTLIELLMVIAIVAILSVVVILVINPIELLRQARDSNRLADMDTLKRAVQLYEIQALSSSPGNASTTYFSLVDLTATTTLGTDCAGIGGLTPPSGWTYHCAASSTLRDIDGTGWLPANFTSITSRPFSHLPVDPVNTSSSGQYYTYAPGNSFHLTALLESSRHLSKAANDGGTDPVAYEAGTSLSISPFAHGLVSSWSFDEGSGASALDQSGLGNHAVWSGTGTHYAAGKVKTAGQFNGTNDQAITGSLDMGIRDFTLMAWIKPATFTASWQRIIASTGTITNAYSLLLGDSVPKFTYQVFNSGHEVLSAGTLSTTTWQHVAVSFHEPTDAVIFYLNGQQDSSYSTDRQATSTNQTILGATSGGSQFFNGLMDEVRIYNRVLSAREIQAIYDSTP